MGHRNRRDGLERSSGRGISRHSAGSAGERGSVFKSDRTGALDPTAALGHSPLAQRAEGAPYRIEYGVRADTSAPVLWIEESGCWFADADGKPARVQWHCPHRQRTPCPRRATGEIVPARPADRRTQSHASDRTLAEAIEKPCASRSSCASFMLIGIDHLARINDAFGFDVADAVISRRWLPAFAPGCAAATCSAGSPAKFGLILKNCTVDDMNIAAERFLAGIRDEVVPTKSGPVSVTAIDWCRQRAALRAAPDEISTAPTKRSTWRTVPVAAPDRFRSGVRISSATPKPCQHSRHRRNRHRAQ